jgi:RNA polymerase sigma-70 factor (ECF subfamily)
MRAIAVEPMGAMQQTGSAGFAAGRRAAVTPPVAAAADGAALAEASLIEAARAGDAAAFSELVDRHMRRAFAVAYRLLGQRQDAEDVVQDSFVAALVKIDTFEPGRPFAPWLLRIVANRALNLRKSRALRQTEPIPAGAASGNESPMDAAERGERQRALRGALRELPEQQRWIVELFEIDGFTSPEIAGMLEMAEGTVRWHLHTARQRLRTVLARFAMRTP